MKFKAPIITLGAGLVVAGVLYALNVDLSNDVARNNASANQTAAVAKTTAAATKASEPPPSAPASSAAVVGDGSGPAAQQGTVTYAGAVDGGAASLGIVINNGKAIAYVCDGKVAEAWVEGAAENGQISLTSAKGTLTGTYGGGQIKGTVTAGKKSWGFTIKVATPPSGLYRSQASLRKKLDASWVVTPDGKQVGVDNTDGTPKAAAPFDMNSKTATVGGTTVSIEATTPSTGY